MIEWNDEERVRPFMSDANNLDFDEATAVSPPTGATGSKPRAPTNLATEPRLPAIPEGTRPMVSAAAVSPVTPVPSVGHLAAPLERSSASQPESTRGVPANPFAGLTDVALEGFLDCTLAESAANPAVGPEVQWPVGPAVPSTDEIRKPYLAMTPAVAVAAASSNSRLLLGFGLAGAVAVGLVAGMVLMKGGGSSEATTPAAVAQVAVATPSLAGEAQPTIEPVAVIAPEPAAVIAPASIPALGLCELNLKSLPSRAELVLQDELLGTTPYVGSIACNTTSVLLRKHGYSDVTQSIHLSSDLATDLEIQLERPLREILVTSEPSGAEVWIDGSLREMTPATLTVTGFEEHSIKIRRLGFKSITKAVRPEEDIEFSAKLKKSGSNSKRSRGAKKIVSVENVDVKVRPKAKVEVEVEEKTEPSMLELIDL